MVDIAWPSTPLVRVTSLHHVGDRGPSYTSEWAPEDEHAYPIEADSITFDVEFVSDRSSGRARFRIGVETVDENNNTQVVHPTQDHGTVYNNQPMAFTLAVPLTPVLTNALTRFIVTIEVFRDSTATGTDYWDPPESRTFSALYVPIVEIAETVQQRCFIATAAYGSELAPPVQFLREFRDDVILRSRFSRAFEKLLEGYYWFSPPNCKSNDS